MGEMFYLLVCRECGSGDLVMPFDSAAERGKWAAGHTAGTGHDRWFVTDEYRGGGGGSGGSSPTARGTNGRSATTAALHNPG